MVTLSKTMVNSVSRKCHDPIEMRDPFPVLTGSSYTYRMQHQKKKALHPTKFLKKLISSNSRYSWGQHTQLKEDQCWCPTSVPELSGKSEDFTFEQEQELDQYLVNTGPHGNH